MGRNLQKMHEIDLDVKTELIHYILLVTENIIKLVKLFNKQTYRLGLSSTL